MRNDRLLRACERKKVDRIPIWFMRQVGRYLPEYRELRCKKTFTEICRSPELVAELTALPVEKFGVDGAIIFSDILTPIEACGFQVKIEEKRGEVFVERIRTEKDVERLSICPAESLNFVYEGIRLARRLLNGKVPVIGFAGAPFTLACYLIEGRATRNMVAVKQTMFNNTALWNSLMERLKIITLNHVTEQVKAGAEIIQVFDSWAGVLSPRDYSSYVLPHLRGLLDEIKKTGCYIIYFATCSAGILNIVRELDVDVIGLDWRIDIEQAWRTLGEKVGVQGNLDPAKLLADKKIIMEEAKTILDKVGSKAGYIFNLGHGILPNTPCENVASLVDYVHSYEVKDP